MACNILFDGQRFLLCAGAAILDSEAEYRISNIKDLLHPLAHPIPSVSSYAIQLCCVMQANRIMRVCSRSGNCDSRSQVLVILIWKRHLRSILHLLLVLFESGLVDCDLGRSKSWCGHKLERAVSDQFPSKPEERLLEVVVGLCRDVVVLEVLLSVESDGLCLDLPLLHIDLVAAENDWDVFANSDDITYTLSAFPLQFYSMPYLRCQLGTFLYVIRDVTSNMMMAHWPLM